MIQKILLAMIALAVGVAVGALTLGETKTDAAASAGAGPQARAGADSDYARIIDGLSATLELEVAERQRLEDEVQALQSELAQIRGELAELSAPGVTGPVASRSSAADEIDPEPDAAMMPFLEAGFDPERAQYVKELQDELALQRLYVRDQAEREGWLRTPRYRDAMQALNEREASFAQDLGDDDYERYLYAIGRPNRVLVGDVLANGPAQQAGIQVGDAILSYGGERIFDAGTLVNATRTGTAGMSTGLEIERDGQTQLVYVPRGPLGINLRVARVKPSS